MRIEVPTTVERFGAVRIFSMQHIFELDSGSNLPGRDPQKESIQTIRRISNEVLNDIEKRMAIIVPCKQERLKVMRGVLSGIPHDCLIILVSNSNRKPVDRFRMEQDVFAQFCQFVQRSAVLVHQRDPGLGEAFAAGGYSDLLDEEGLVQHGKGEGMLIGMALAKLSGKDFVGFVDADNYVPGAVQEYVKDFAAGLHMAQTPYSMVRVSWNSKPKVSESRLFFERWGRASEVTNRFLNLLLSDYTGFGTDIIRTGNSGEHAMTLRLGELLSFAPHFGVEPYQYINMLEMFGGVHASPHPEVMESGVEIYQIETLNPHFHEDKGDDHVDSMSNTALSTIYNSSICTSGVKEAIRQHVKENEGSLQSQRPYPPLKTLNVKEFFRVLSRSAATFQQIRPVTGIPVLAAPPIVVPESS